MRDLSRLLEYRRTSRAMESILRLTSLLLFSGLSIGVSANSGSYVPCDYCVDRATPTELAKIELRLYPNLTIIEYTEVLIGEAVTLIDKIDTDKPTVLYVSGWRETPDSPSVTAVLNAYLSRQDHNVMLLDWRLIAAQLYPYSALSVNGIGYTVANAFNKLVAAGLNPATLHLVGHSLGAQISGAIGRNVGFRVPRITGLDPAGPGFYFVAEDLTSEDAEFVDVIHTDAGVFGIQYDFGTVNFHPNGGASPQPGCTFSGTLADICSHARSWIYYAESVMNEDAFIGIECDSYLKFASGLCSSNESVIMGYAVRPTAKGKVYLETNRQTPYGQGNYGKTYRGVHSLTNKLL